MSLQPVDRSLSCSSSSSSASGSLEEGKDKGLLAIEAALENKLIVYLKYLNTSNLARMSHECRIPQSPGNINYGTLAAAVTQFAGDQCALSNVDKLYRWVFADARYFLATDRILGKGNFATVYHGFTLDGEGCAIKMGAIREEEVRHLKKFASKLSTQSNINRLLASDLRFIRRNQAVAILELADTSLSKVSELNLTGKHMQIVLRGILSGLNQVAEARIIHSDLKEDNVLLIKRDDYFVAKISDFGGAVRFGEPVTGGTAVYHPPEFFYKALKKESLRYDQMHKMDVWTAMLIFGKCFPGLLSNGFQKRFAEYLSLVDQAEKTVKENQTIVKDNQKTVKNFSELLREFYCEMATLLNQRFPGQRGVFSDLPAKTPLDHLMQAMAMFDPRDRVSAQEAIRLFDGLFTEKLSPALDSHFEEWEFAEDFHSEEWDSSFFASEMAIDEQPCSDGNTVESTLMDLD